jgi:hypothetical protein
MLLGKGMKSYQLALNSLIPKGNRPGVTASNAAYCKARAKFRHTAFIELNQVGVVAVMYGDGDYARFKDFRLLAIDGSKIRLPETDETIDAFGTRAYRNKQHDIVGEHCMALSSVVYDVLNRIALDARLLPVATHEVTAAVAQLKDMQLGPKDLVIEDRGYHSYRMMAAIVQTGSHFLIRCKRNSGMRVADDMLAGNGGSERIETIIMPAHLAKRQEYQGLPTTLRVRFVRVKLKDGSAEVLATSVLSRSKLTREDCKQLYHLRWGIETFYGILKTRLGLENFSGYSVEAIQQDFHAAVLLTGLESILTGQAAGYLARQKGGHPKQVNKAVSFNAIKEHAFALFMSDHIPSEQATEELTRLFLTSPTLSRKDRNPPRNRHPDNKVLDWYKRKRKIVI